MAKQKTEIIINDRWKVVRYDALNWQPYERREVKETNNPKLSTCVGELDWFATGRYFGQLVPAMRWIAEEQIADSGEKYDLMQAVSAIETSNLKLAKDIRAALKNVDV